MKILLLAWNRQKRYNWGHELFRRELAKYHDVLFYGSGYYCNYDSNITINKILKLYGRPHIIFIHVEHREKCFPTGLADALGNITDIFKVHYCGDYDKKTWPKYNDHLRRAKYDLLFVSDSQVTVDLKRHGIGGIHCLFPYSVDTSIFYNRHLEKVYDISTPFSKNQRCRRRLIEFISGLNNVNISLERVYKEAYVKRINETKIIATCDKSYGSFSLKYTEVMACGTLIMGDRIDDLEKLGLKDGEHLILYDGLKDLEDKIYYFLKHDREREKIAKNGMKFVREYHSMKTRIKEFTKIVQEELRKSR